MEQKERSGNIQIVDGVRCRVIGGKNLVTYRDIANYTGHTPGSIAKKASKLGLRTYRIGRFAALEKIDADSLVIGGAA